MKGNKREWRGRASSFCLFVAALGTWPLVPAGGPPFGDLPADRRELVRSGSWRPNASGEADFRRWSVRLRRGSDGTVRGPVVLVGSPLVGSGRLSARSVGETVVGQIRDVHGSVLVRFEGILREGTLRGTYTDRTGETGTWEWDAASLP